MNKTPTSLFIISGDDSFKSSEATQAEVKTKRLFVTGKVIMYYT